MNYQDINPYNGIILKTVAELTEQQIETAVHAPQQCFETWRYTTARHR